MDGRSLARPRRVIVIALALGCLFGPAAHASLSEVAAQVDQYLPGAPEPFGVRVVLTDEQAKALTAAFDEMERARVLDGSNEANLSAYAQVTEALGHTDLAAVALRKLVKKTPDDADRWRRLGAALAELGPKRGADAFEALEKARDLNPDDPRTHYLIGSLYHQQGLYDAAREAYTRAGDLDISKVGSAVLKVYANNLVGAETDLRAMGAAAQPFDVQTRLWLRDALFDWEHSGHFVPDTPEAHSAMARLLYRAARLPEAILAARHVTVLTPEDADTWNLLGAMFMQLGDPTQARQAYEASLQANPDQPALRDALQNAPQQQGQGPLR